MVTLLIDVINSVAANDECMYEENNLKEWLQDDVRSPLTKQVIATVNGCSLVSCCLNGKVEEGEVYEVETPILIEKSNP